MNLVWGLGRFDEGFCSIPNCFKSIAGPFPLVLLFALDLTLMVDFILNRIVLNQWDLKL
jgi:hypothetical protein